MEIHFEVLRLGLEYPVLQYVVPIFHPDESVLQLYTVHVDAARGKAGGGVCCGCLSCMSAMF